MSDFESCSGCDEDMEDIFKRNGSLGSNFTTIDLSYFVDESPKPSFRDVLLESLQILFNSHLLVQISW